RIAVEVCDVVDPLKRPLDRTEVQDGRDECLARAVADHTVRRIGHAREDPARDSEGLRVLEDERDRLRADALPGERQRRARATEELEVDAPLPEEGRARERLQAF